MKGKKYIYLIAIIILTLSIITPVLSGFAANTKTYYVDLKGNDKNPGTAAKPWRTIAYAAKKVGKSQNTTIHINKGTFIEKETIDLPVGVNLEGSGKNQTIIKSKFSEGNNGITWEDSLAKEFSEGDWLRFSNVDMGKGYKYFTAKVNFDKSIAAKQNIEVRLDSPKGKLVATLNIKKASNTKYPKELFTQMTGGTGKHDIYLVFKGIGSIDFSACRFTTNYTIPQDNETDLVKEKTTANSDIYLPASACKGTIIKLWSDPYGEDGNQSLSNFTVDGSKKEVYEGIFIRGRNNVKVHDINIIDTYDHGLRVIARSQIHINPSKPLTGIEIYNCYLKNCSTYSSLSGETGPGCSGALEIGGLDGALIYNNKIEETEILNGYCIKFNAGGMLHRSKIYDNINTGSEYSEFTIELWSSYESNQVYNNTSINGGMSFVFGNKGKEWNKRETGDYSVKVFNNIIKYTYPAFYRNGIELNINDGEVCNNLIQNAGKGVAAYGDCDNAYIHNNIFSFPNNKSAYEENKGQGVLFNGNTATNIRVHNNVFENYGTVLLANAKKFENIDVKNNICLNVKYGMSIANDGKNIVFANNALSGFDKILSTFGIAEKNIELANDNEFGLNLSGNIPDPYFRLKDASKLIDMGIKVEIPFSGNAPDIGAIEAGVPVWKLGSITKK